MWIGGQIKPRRPPLDPAQRQMLDRVIADRAETQGIAHGAVDNGQGEKVSIRRKTCTYSRLPAAQRFFRLSRASSNRRSVANSVGSDQPCIGAA